MKLTCEQLSLTDQAAALVVNAVCEYAALSQLNVCVSVLDPHGNPLTFQRMNGAPLLSISIAEDKAYTAVSFGLDTSQWQQRVEKNPHMQHSLINRPRMLMLGGGIPIYQGNTIIGAVGVSGASEQQDNECAIAGVSAFNDLMASANAQ